MTERHMTHRVARPPDVIRSVKIANDSNNFRLTPASFSFIIFANSAAGNSRKLLDDQEQGNENHSSKGKLRCEIFTHESDYGKAKRSRKDREQHCSLPPEHGVVAQHRVGGDSLQKPVQRPPPGLHKRRAELVARHNVLGRDRLGVTIHITGTALAVFVSSLSLTT